MKIKLVRRGLIPLFLIVCLCFLVFGIRVSVSVNNPIAHADGPGPTQTSSFITLGQADSTTWVKEDTVRGVICYVYYYRDHDNAGSAGGISCIPKSQLAVGAR